MPMKIVKAMVTENMTHATVGFADCSTSLANTHVSAYGYQTPELIDDAGDRVGSGVGTTAPHAENVPSVHVEIVPSKHDR